MNHNPAGGSPDLPQKIGSYRIEERLGAGGIGVVYRAFDEVLQRPLAIKHLLPERTSPTAVLRFRREARMAARLNHAFIVHIYDIVETAAGDWIVMELVEGETLDRKIRERTLTLRQAVQLGREIAEGLAEAHAQGIVHRDLKTSNVMVTPAGHAKILDFGLAKLIDQDAEPELSQTGVVLGTYHAMSPEQVQGMALDHRSDLFSFGSLLYEMLTGVSPFRAPGVTDTLARVCSYQPSPVRQVCPEVPQELSDLVGWLLRKDPGLRPQSTQQVAGLLEELERSDPARQFRQRPVWREMHVQESTVFEGYPPQPAAPSTAPTRPTSERRQVTVVCCELVRTAAGEERAGREVDPEVLHELMARLKALGTAAAERHGGSFGGIVGRRILIYFGYPQAFEDNAARAVRAAFDLVEQVPRLEADLERPFRLTAQVGIHTGPAVVTASEPGAEPVTLGATLDLTLELQSAAAPGLVVVSPATASLLGRSFALEPLASVRLPGLNADWTPQRVLEPLELTEDSSAPVLPLVGREAELELLLGRWSLAQQGTGQAVLISGEAGLGKSRLALALRERRRDGEARWLACFGAPSARNSPLQPVASLLRQTLVPSKEEAAVESVERALRDLSLESALPLFAPLLDIPAGEAPPAPPLAPERLREKTLEALVELVLEMAQRQPLVLLIEDLHWLDPTTLDWLDRLIEQVSAVPLFLVLTMRPQPEVSWGQHPHLTRIALSPLTGDEAARLVDQVAGERSLPPATRRQIVARTDGIPLFLEELTKSALESDGASERQELPTTLRDSLTARLDRLGPAKEIAQIAAVIGREFTTDLLAAVAARGEGELQRELRRLIQAELIHRKGFGAQTRYLFKHALVQDAAYDSLLKRERQQLHRRIAEALEERFPATAESRPELLAHHYTEAGMAAPAAGFWYRAGQRASSRSAASEAISHLSQALRLLAALPQGAERDRRELEVQSALAAATIAGRGFLDPGVEQSYERAEQLAKSLAETEERFWAVVGLHTFHVARGDLPRALELAELLLAIAEMSGSAALLAGARFWMGCYRYYRSDFAAALPELEQAFTLAPPGDLSYRMRTGIDLRVLALCFAALALWHRGDPRAAQEHGRLAIEIAGGLDHPFSLCFARGLGGAVLNHYLRDATAVHREAQAVYTLSEDLGFPLWSWQSKFLLVWAESTAPGGGPPAHALGAYDDTQTIAGLAGSGMDYFFCVRTEILRAQGRTGDALRALDEALALLPEQGAPAWSGELRRLRGEIAQEGGGEAEPLFTAALDIARRCGSRALELRAALSLARLWAGQGRGEEARALVSAVCAGFCAGGGSAATPELREAAAFLAGEREAGEREKEG